MISAVLDKRYGASIVLTGARLRVRPGTVHALVGENGAGKSTLVRILAGVVRGDAGALQIAGVPVDAAHDVQQRRLARAVLAHQAMHLPRVHVEGNAVERAHTWEHLADIVKTQRR